MGRTLSLTSPYMKGDDVLRAQKRLGAVTVKDGIYGPATAGAVKDWKYRIGLPMKFVNTNLTASDWAYLSGKKKPSAAMQLRAKRRAKQGDGVPGADKGYRALSIMREWANQQLVEQPRNSNVVPRLVVVGRQQNVRTFYSNMGYPWCAYAVMLAALGAGSTTAKQGLVDGRFNPLYVPEIEQLARQGTFGMRVVSWNDARPGDFVTFNWDGGVPDHIGMIMRMGKQSATCVEGNTSPTNAGSQSNGGGVFVRDRSRTQIQAIIRWS